MRIAVWHNLSSGGASRVLFDQASGLVRRGHHVEVWSPATADHAFLPLDASVEERVLELSGVDGRPRSLSLREIVSGRRDDIVAMDQHGRAVAEQIDQGDFDVLLANCCRFFRTTSIARQVTIPSVLIAEPLRELFDASPGYPWAAAPPGWSGLIATLREAARVRGLRIQVREEIANALAYDRLVAFSSFTREMILRSYGADSTVCYPGIDLRTFRPAGRDREPFVVSVGAVCADKNVEFVVRAVGNLPDSHRRLVWVADQVDEQVLRRARAIAAEFSVSFELEQRVDDARLIDLLNRASLMAYAPRLEPLGLAPLEAGACGLPVVAVAEAGVRETVVDGITGSLTGPTVPEFATEMRRLLADPAERAALGGRAVKHVGEQWSLELAVDRLEAVLEEAVIEGRRTENASAI